MVVYVDKEHKCHVFNDGTMTPVENNFFDGKCQSFIEGYCYDESNGHVHIYPWEPYADLDEAQQEYEREKLAEYEAMIDELYTEVTAE